MNAKKKLVHEFKQLVEEADIAYPAVPAAKVVGYGILAVAFALLDVADAIRNSKGAKK